MSFTSVPGTYFWSNGSAWGNCLIEENKATITVMFGKIGIASFMLGNGTPLKVKDIELSANLKPSYRFDLK